MKENNAKLVWVHNLSNSVLPNSASALAWLSWLYFQLIQPPDTHPDKYKILILQPKHEKQSNLYWPCELH